MILFERPELFDSQSAGDYLGCYAEGAADVVRDESPAHSSEPWTSQLSWLMPATLGESRRTDSAFPSRNVSRNQASTIPLFWKHIPHASFQPL